MARFDTSDDRLEEQRIQVQSVLTNWHGKLYTISAMHLLTVAGKICMTDIKAIIENAASDRITTKQHSEALILHQALPESERLTNLWYNRFIAFRTHTLKKSSKETPTGQEMERFLDAKVSKAKLTVNAVPSLASAKRGLERLFRRCI